MRFVGTSVTGLGQGPGALVPRGDPQPCPICGHPTGDCTEDHLMAKAKDTETADEAVETAPEERTTANPGSNVSARKMSDDAPEGTTAGQSGVIRDEAYVQAAFAPRGLNVDDFRGKFEELEDGTFRATEDIEEEFNVPNTKRPSTRLIASKGSVFTAAQLAALEDGSGLVAPR